MQDAPQNPVPEKVTGIAHLFAATRYSSQAFSASGMKQPFAMSFWRQRSGLDCS
jgi:hypothetical protein